jgi:CheY-like chemotaxis protein
MRKVKKGSILVVDDDPDFIYLFEKLISKVDPYTIVKAKDGMEGILKCRNQNFSYIFTDYNMPKVSGDEFINTVRRGHYNYNTPIVLVSSSKEKKIPHDDNGENIYFLEKPLHLKDLKEALRNSPERILKNKKNIDLEFINEAVSGFKDILTTLGNFEDISKETTQKLNPDNNQQYDYYGCIIIHSEKFNGIITVAFPQDTFEEYIIENIDNTIIQSSDQIFETFIQTLVTKTKKMLKDTGDPVYEINSVFGVGHTELLSSRESIIEFYTTFNSSKGQFFVQVSAWE